LKNFLGQTSTAGLTIKIVDSEDIPSVYIAGTSPVVMYRWQDLSLVSVVGIPQCIRSSLKSLTYTWNLYDGTSLNRVVGLNSINKDPRYFLIPRYSLTAGSNYIVKVVIGSSTTRSSIASVSVQVAKSGVVARILGGSVRTTTTADVLVLDGSSSADIDYPANTVTGAASVLDYKWYCITLSPVYGSLCPNFPTNATRAICQPPSTFLSSFGGSGIFISLVVSNSFGMSGVANTTVYVSRTPTPMVQIDSSQSIYAVGNNIILTSKIVGTAVVAAIQAKWSASAVS